MEDPRTHVDDKNHHHHHQKKNGMPVVRIDVGGGSFGIGGIVLLGGALVTATLVSAFAIKTGRRQRHRSLSPDKKKNKPESVDEPSNLELMMKSSKDRESSKHFSASSYDPSCPHPSDGRSNMEEMQIEATRTLILDEKQKLGMINGDKEEPQRGNQELSAADEVEGKKMAEKGEEAAVMPCRSSQEESYTEETEIGTFQVNDAKKQNHVMLVGHENNECTDTSTERPLASHVALNLRGGGKEEEMAEKGEGIKVVIEHKEGIDYNNDVCTSPEPAEVQVHDVAEEAEEGHVDEDEEKVLVNEAAAAAAAVQKGAMEADGVDQVEIEDNPEVQISEEAKEEGIKPIGLVDEDQEAVLMNKAAAVEVPHDDVGEEEEHVDEDQDRVLKNEAAVVVQEETMEAGHVDHIKMQCQEEEEEEEDKVGGIKSACGEERVTVEEKEGIVHHKNDRNITAEASAVEVPQAYNVAEVEEKGEIVGEDQETELMIEAATLKDEAMHQNEDIEEAEAKKEGGNRQESIHSNGEGNLFQTFSAEQNVREEKQQMQNNSEQQGTSTDKSLLIAPSEETTEALKEEAIESAGLDLVNAEEVKEMELIKEEKGREDQNDDNGGVMQEKTEESWEMAHETIQHMHKGELHETKSIDRPAISLPVQPQRAFLLEAGNVTNLNDSLKLELADQIAANVGDAPRQLIKREEKCEETSQDVQVETPQVQPNGEEDEGDENDEEDVTEEAEESSEGTGDSSKESSGAAIWPEELMQEEFSPENKSEKTNDIIEEHMEEDRTTAFKEHTDGDKINDEKHSKKPLSYSERFMMDLAKQSKQAPAREPRKMRLRAWSILVLSLCLCHCYFGLPPLKLGLVGIMLSIVILLGFPNSWYILGQK